MFLLLLVTSDEEEILPSIGSSSKKTTHEINDHEDQNLFNLWKKANFLCFQLPVRSVQWSHRAGDPHVRFDNFILCPVFIVNVMTKLDQGRQSDAKRSNVQGWHSPPFRSPPHQPGTASAVQLSFLHSRFCTEIFKLHILSVVFIISKFSDWKLDGEDRRWPGGLCHHKRSSSSWRNDPQAGIAVVKPQNLLI